MAEASLDTVDHGKAGGKVETVRQTGKARAADNDYVSAILFLTFPDRVAQRAGSDFGSLGNRRSSSLDCSNPGKAGAAKLQVRHDHRRQQTAPLRSGRNDAHSLPDFHSRQERGPEKAADRDAQRPAQLSDSNICEAPQYNGIEWPASFVQTLPYRNCRSLSGIQRRRVAQICRPILGSFDVNGSFTGQT